MAGAATSAATAPSAAAQGQAATLGLPNPVYGAGAYQSASVPGGPTPGQSGAKNTNPLYGPGSIGPGQGDYQYSYQNFTPNTDLNSQAGNLQSSLAYQTFLKGMGYTDTLAKAQANNKIAALRAQEQAAAPMYAQQLQEGLTNDLNSSAARGGTNSSARLLSQANTQQGINNAQANYDAQIASQIGDTQNNLANTLANSNVAQAQAQLQAEQQLLDQANAQAAYKLANQNAANYLKSIRQGVPFNFGQ